MRVWVGMLAVAAGCGDAETKDGEEAGCVQEVPYDGVDQDCDGADLRDVDGDGSDALQVGGADCDDDNPEFHPGANDIPYDGLDQDCGGGDRIDVDEDGEPAIEAGGADCNDLDAVVHPGAPDQFGNSVDEDCDGADGVDADEDGWASVSSGSHDCNDGNPDIHPDAAEIWYDGVDQNCDRVCDYDQDEDGAVLPGSPITDQSVCDLDNEQGQTYAPQDCNEEDPEVTDVSLASTTPLDGAWEVPVGGTIVALLSEADPAPAMVVRDPDGNAVPGTTLVLASAVEFTPDPALLEGTEYTIEVTHGCGTESTSFHTTYPAIPLDPQALVGRVWQLTLGQGNWVEPAGIGALLGSQFGTSALLMEVVAANGDVLDVRVGTGDGYSQDLCVSTADATADFSANPDVTVGPGDWSFVAAGARFDFTESVFTGGVRADGELVVNGALESKIDTRYLGEALGIGYDAEAVCDLIAAFGVDCLPCADGLEVCLGMRVEDLVALDNGVALVPRTIEEVEADVNCP